MCGFYLFTGVNTPCEPEKGVHSAVSSEVVCKGGVVGQTLKKDVLLERKEGHDAMTNEGNENPTLLCIWKDNTRYFF